jgi:hypothetical protein
MNKKIDVSQQTGFDLFLIGNFTYKELGYALYMTRRFTIEIEYNGHW